MKVKEVEQLVLTGKRVSPATLKNYRCAFASVKRYTEEWFENAVQVNTWVASMPKEYSDETVVDYFNCMMAAGNFLQKSMGRNKDGSFKFFNVFIDAERPKIKKKNRRIFNQSQLVDIMKACRSEQEIALIGVLIDSTCRIGELVGLRLTDVGPGFFLNRTGKTGQRRYRLDLRICEQLANMVKSPDEVIFKDMKSKPAKVYHLEHYVRDIIKRAGITGKKVGAHTIRHSGATLIASKTGSALAVKAALQHDKIETSMLYIHEVEDKIQQANSPMAMVNVAPQVPMLTDGKTEVIDGAVISAVDMTERMFDSIPDGIGVRPLLKARDLFLLRTVMVDFSREYRGDSRVYECQGLLKRMLRKAR